MEKYKILWYQYVLGAKRSSKGVAQMWQGHVQVVKVS